MMSDVVTADYIADATCVQEDHYREVAERLRLMADIEPLASVRRHLRWLAAQHDKVAAQPAGRLGLRCQGKIERRSREEIA
jgi:hypothetical protein